MTECRVMGRASGGPWTGLVLTTRHHPEGGGAYRPPPTPQPSLLKEGPNFPPGLRKIFSDAFGANWFGRKCCFGAFDAYKYSAPPEGGGGGAGPPP